MFDGLFLPTDSEDELWQKLHDFTAKHYGITSMLYGFCHNRKTVVRTGITNALVIKTSHPTDYMEHFADIALLDDDSSAMRLFHSTEPFLWSDTENWPGVTPAQIARSQVDNALGMQSGVSIGFSFSDGQGVSGIGLAARYVEVEKFAAIWENYKHQIIALITHVEPMLRQRMIELRFQLSPREKDVLMFSAGGLGAKEIANHLNIKPKTVFNALKRARERMLAASTAEAVAKAYVFRLI